jgi:hypothetical protein
VNPDQFLCEGTPVLDSSGNLIFDPTSFISDSGLPVSRERCNFSPRWNANNQASFNLPAPDSGRFVSTPCKDGEIGPMRDCGFSAKAVETPACSPGQTVRLSCTADDAPQVLRVCEKSEALGGVDCTLRDSPANAIVKTNATTVTFTCPAVRDATVPGTGGYSLYRAPLLPSVPSDTLSCKKF